MNEMFLANEAEMVHLFYLRACHSVVRTVGGVLRLVGNNASQKDGFLSYRINPRVK